MSQITTKPRAEDLLQRVSPDMYREAYKRGMSLSAFLEAEDPSEGYNDGLDAFGRLLKAANIRARSVTQYGVYADTFEAFERSDQTRALVPEFMARVWRRATHGMSAGGAGSRAIYTSQDGVAGSSLRPFIEATPNRADLISPAIPLSEIVAITTPIEGDVYRAFYLTPDTDEARKVRVAEGAEVPRAKLTGGERTIGLRKFGRALEVTYEQLRRMRIDIVAFHIARLAVQAETDKVAAALSTIVNGDGNPGTAATAFDASDLDALSVGGVLTLQAYLAYKMKFASPYQLTTILAREAGALKLMLLNTGSGNIPLATINNALGVGGIRPINQGLADGVAMGWISEAPADALVGFDSRLALEHVVEIGANITEVDRWVTRQAEVLVMTEVEGFAIFDQNATKVLNLV